jgi:hypothetical protein
VGCCFEDGALREQDVDFLGRTTSRDTKKQPLFKYMKKKFTLHERRKVIVSTKQNNEFPLPVSGAKEKELFIQWCARTSSYQIQEAKYMKNHFPTPHSVMTAHW